MYCLKCRRVTETQDITTATSKNGRLMSLLQCVTCGKTKTQFVKKDVAGGSFSKFFSEQTPFRNASARSQFYWPRNKTK